MAVPSVKSVRNIQQPCANPLVAKETKSLSGNPAGNVNDDISIVIMLHHVVAVFLYSMLLLVFPVVLKE